MDMALEGCLKSGKYAGLKGRTESTQRRGVYIRAGGKFTRGSGNKSEYGHFRKGPLLLVLNIVGKGLWQGKRKGKKGEEGAGPRKKSFRCWGDKRKPKEICGPPHGLGDPWKVCE